MTTLLSTDVNNTSSISNDFNSFSALFHLLSELFIIFGWVHNNKINDDVTQKGSSIFTGTLLENRLPTASQTAYKTRTNFSSDREYGQYLESIIQPGMRVRARVGYSPVREGDVGTYRGRGNTVVDWDRVGEMYWGFWPFLEIINDHPTNVDCKYIDYIALVIQLM